MDTKNNKHTKKTKKNVSSCLCGDLCFEILHTKKCVRVCVCVCVFALLKITCRRTHFAMQSWGTHFSLCHQRKKKDKGTKMLASCLLRSMLLTSCSRVWASCASASAPAPPPDMACSISVRASVCVCLGHWSSTTKKHISPPLNNTLVPQHNTLVHH